MLVVFSRSAARAPPGTRTLHDHSNSASITTGDSTKHVVVQSRVYATTGTAVNPMAYVPQPCWTTQALASTHRQPVSVKGPQILSLIPVSLARTCIVVLRRSRAVSRLCYGNNFEIALALPKVSILSCHEPGFCLSCRYPSWLVCLCPNHP